MIAAGNPSSGDDDVTLTSLLDEPDPRDEHGGRIWVARLVRSA